MTTPNPPHKNSCLLCARRKIKCDKQDPTCSNCTKSHAECIYQAPNPPQRHRKRPADDDLVLKLKEYEELLRQNGIAFGDGAERELRSIPVIPPLEQSPLEAMLVSSRRLEPEKIEKLVVEKGDPYGWASLSTELRNPPMQRLPRKTKDGELHPPIDQLASKKISGIESFLLADVSSHQEQLHPEPRHIFRLWQIFVENVNPLIKILHVPTFQQRIFEVSWNIPSISKPTQAIMFAVYMLAITSLSNSDCQKLFAKDRDDLLEQYRESTIRSLIAAEILTTRDLEVLQAFVLFLLADPDGDATVTLAAVAVRIGQKMGLHRENPAKKLSFFETEMRIRLWWQIRGIDARARHATGGCLPCSDFGDIRLPLNVNDSELHPNMADAPIVHTGTTEMLYCLLKHEVAQWFRTSPLAAKVFKSNKSSNRLDFVSSPQPLEIKDQAIQELERIYEDKYLRHCDPRIPLHFIALSISRLVICRIKFMAHHPRNKADLGVQMSQEEHDLLFFNSVRLLELDHETSKTSYSQQLLAHMTAKSQLDALIYMLSELRRRATGDLVLRAWNMLSIIYAAHAELTEDTTNTFYVSLGDLTLQAWETRQRELLSKPGTRIEEVTPPFIYALLATRKRDNIEVTATDGFQGLGMGALPGGWDPSTGFSGGFSMEGGFGGDPLDWGYWNEFLQV